MQSSEGLALCPNKASRAVPLELLFSLQETCSYEKQLKTAHHLYKRLFSSYIQILRLLQFLVLSKTGRAGTRLTGHNPVQTPVTPGVAPHNLSCEMTMVSNLGTPNPRLEPLLCP